MTSTPTAARNPTGHSKRSQADAVVLAAGQDADSGFLREVPGIEFARDGS